MEHPILFSEPMVKAILEGRKTQTRRVIDPQFSKLWGSGVRNDDPNYFSVHVNIAEPDGTWKWVRCPYGKFGDLLWVRETWGMVGPELGDSWWYKTVETRKMTFHPDSNIREGIGAAIYRADGDFPFPADWRKWRPSIHMPRWASRLTLEIINVKAERLWEMTVNKMLAEGVTEGPEDDGKHELTPFITLWDSINGKRPGCGWQNNPWVWVVEFERKSCHALPNNSL